jgi:adenylylsulfate kinase
MVKLDADKNIKLSAVIWLTGLSGSGKTTIAAAIESELLKNQKDVIILDGDWLRNGLNSDLGFTPADRQENVRRCAEVANLFLKKGFIVICSLISPFEKDRRNARSIIGDRFFEIYLKCSVDECIKRDVKGLYKQALNGIINNFTGISSPYEEPINPELIINTEDTDVIAATKFIIELLY